MVQYIARRLLRTFSVLVGLSVIVFLLLKVSGDPATVLLPPEATERQAVEMRKAYGLDRPLPVQYWRFFTRAIRGDFGDSWQYRIPATRLVVEAMPATMQLAACALAIALLVGVPLGIIAAIRERSWIDMLCVTFGVVGRAMP